MKRFGKRCAMALVAGCLALPLSAADLPPKFDYVSQLLAYACQFGGYPCTGDAALSEFQQLGTATILMVNRIRDWMIESDKNTKALQEDVKGLKKDVAELKEAVARLQQGTPPGTPKPPDEARISALEARVAKLEAERNAVRAPFRVLDAAGQALLTLDIRGNLAVGKPGGSMMLFTHQEDGKATLGVDSADGHVAALMATDGGHLVLSNSKSGARVEASAGETPAISVSDPSQSVEMGIGQALFGLKLSAGDKPAAVLGTMPGRGVALRLFDDSGKVVAGAGSNPAAGGAGLVFAGSGGATNAAVLAAESDGTGLVQAFSADGTVAAGLVGKDRMVAAYNSTGSAVATIGKSEQSEGGNVTARNPSGDGVFRAGFRTDLGGGEACVYRVKTQMVSCLGLGVPGMGVGK